MKCKCCKGELTQKEEEFNSKRVGGKENPICFKCARIGLNALANWLADLIETEGKKK